jgi:hypothetical protein
MLAHSFQNYLFQTRVKVFNSIFEDPYLLTFIIVLDSVSLLLNKFFQIVNQNEVAELPIRFLNDSDKSPGLL